MLYLSGGQSDIPMFATFFINMPFSVIVIPMLMIGMPLMIEK